MQLGRVNVDDDGYSLIFYCQIAFMYNLRRDMWFILNGHVDNVDQFDDVGILSKALDDLCYLSVGLASLVMSSQS